MNRDRYLIILSVLYFAILGCFLLGCSEGTNSSPVSALMGNIDSSHSANKISGLVMDSSTNEPMANIYVQLNYYDSNEEKHFIKGELSASDGSFTFSGLDNGTYSVNITKDNYDVEQPTNKCFVNNGSAFDNYILYLKAKNTNTTSEIKYADMIKGKVKHSDGSSAANTTIYLSKDMDVSSDDKESLIMGDGSFSFFNIEANSNYYIIVNELDKEGKKPVYPIGIDKDGNVVPTDIVINVNVKENPNKVNNVTFQITSAYTGASLELATIKLNGENYGTTNINGEVTIEELPIGTYNIEVSKEGFETMITSRPLSTDSSNKIIYLTMVEDTKDGYGSITGRYVDENEGKGLGNKFVRLYRLIERTQTSNIGNKSETWYDVDKNYILTTKTSNGSDRNGLEGSFKLTHIEPGYYQIYITSDLNDIPAIEERSQIYNDFVWTQLVDNGNCKITQPLKVVGDQTTYWTNYEQDNNNKQGN